MSTIINIPKNSQNSKVLKWIKDVTVPAGTYNASLSFVDGSRLSIETDPQSANIKDFIAAADVEDNTLTACQFTDQISGLASKCFANCAALKEVSLPANFTFQSDTFCSCLALETVLLPVSADQKDILAIYGYIQNEYFDTCFERAADGSDQELTATPARYIYFEQRVPPYFWMETKASEVSTYIVYDGNDINDGIAMTKLEYVLSAETNVNGAFNEYDSATGCQYTRRMSKKISIYEGGDNLLTTDTEDYYTDGESSIGVCGQVSAMVGILRPGELFGCGLGCYTQRSGNDDYSAIDDIAVFDGYGSITALDDIAFSYCGWLKSISCDNVRSIAGTPFDVCINLERAYFNSVTSIGENAFYGCSSLAELHTGMDSDSIALSGNSWFGNDWEYSISVYSNDQQYTVISCTGLQEKDIQYGPGKTDKAEYYTIYNDSLLPATLAHGLSSYVIPARSSREYERAIYDIGYGVGHIYVNGELADSDYCIDGNYTFELDRDMHFNTRPD